MANFAYARNTADRESEEAQLRFSSEIAPRADEHLTKLQARLVGLGYVRPGLETTVSIRLKDIPFAAGVDVICRRGGLKLEAVGDGRVFKKQ